MRILFFLLNLFVIASLFTQSAKADDTPKEFRVGLAVPLTGLAADYGIAIKNSIELAQSDRPELFSNIRFYYEDTLYEPRNAINAFHKLVNSDKVHLTVTWGVSFCKALAPVAESRQIPLVGLCIDPHTAANRKYVLRFMNVTDDFMRVTVNHLKQLGLSRIGLLLSDHPYLEEMTEALKRNVLPGQSITIVDRVAQNESDMRPYILKATKPGIDVLGVFLYVGQISTFYKQARGTRFALPTFGSNLSESFSEVRTAEGAMDGALFGTVAVKPQFIARYKDRYQNESQLAFGAPAYEFALTVGTLFNQKSSSLNAEQIMERFSSVLGAEGVAAGPYSYVNDPKVGRYFKFPVVMKRIRGANFEMVE